MRLRKTDNRFHLRKYGFDCYVEFRDDDWKNYNRYVRYCRDNLGDEFGDFAGRVYGDGNGRAKQHKGKRWSSKRIYFRGEKYYTLLLMAMPLEDNKTFYL